jgi:hypothetical protein
MTTPVEINKTEDDLFWRCESTTLVRNVLMAVVLRTACTVGTIAAKERACYAT